MLPRNSGIWPLFLHLGLELCQVGSFHRFQSLCCAMVTNFWWPKKENKKDVGLFLKISNVSCYADPQIDINIKILHLL